MSRLRLSILVLLIAVTAAACTTRVPVRGVHPARVSLGSGRDLAIVETNGRRHASEFVAHELVRQGRNRGYFRIRDLAHDGARVRVNGRSVSLQGPPLPAHHVGLRIDVLEWGVIPGIKTVHEKTPEGEPHIHIVPVLHARTLLAVTLFDADNRAYLAETEYEGVALSENFEIAREQLIEYAAADAVAHFLADITPLEVVTRVRLDDDDPGQEGILKIAKTGDVYAAAEHLRTYLTRFPYSTPAAYNLAVLLDAMGRYEEALEFYDLAVSRSTKGYYRAARNACLQRLNAAETLAAR